VKSSASGPTLAEKLDRLFCTIHRDGRGEYSYEEVAKAVRANGVMISHTYIWQLRKGMRDNPTKRHLEALAKFFGVSPAYFLDEDAASRIDAQLEMLAAFRDGGVRSVALRAVGLSAPSLQAIQAMIDQARRIEGLPSVEPPSSP
jgi:transcriptional regulator with XRE-family HTH domain